MIRYEYTVITRENSTECGFSHQFWDNHSDWLFFIRTNVRWPGRPDVWVGGGGVTLEEAKAAAELGLRQVSGGVTLRSAGPDTFLLGPLPCEGKESDTIIKNR